MVFGGNLGKLFQRKRDTPLLNSIDDFLSDGARDLMREYDIIPAELPSLYAWLLPNGDSDLIQIKLQRNGMSSSDWDGYARGCRAAAIINYELARRTNGFRITTNPVLDAYCMSYDGTDASFTQARLSDFENTDLRFEAKYGGSTSVHIELANDFRREADSLQEEHNPSPPKAALSPTIGYLINDPWTYGGIIEPLNCDPEDILNELFKNALTSLDLKGYLYVFYVRKMNNGDRVSGVSFTHDDVITTCLDIGKNQIQVYGNALEPVKIGSQQYYAQIQGERIFNIPGRIVLSNDQDILADWGF